MNKKTNMWIVSSLVIVILIMMITVFVNNNKNEAETDISDSDKEQADNTKKIVEEFKEDENFKSKEELDDIINKYKSQTSDEELEDDDIKLKLEEDYGDDVARSFEYGLMVDNDMEDEDVKQVMISSLISQPMGMHPIKKIVNPINNEFNNSEENRYSSITEIKTISSHGYTKDTEGFYEVEGLNIGYPMITYSSEDNVTVSLSLSLLIDKDIKSKEIDNFLDQYKNVNVNGHKLTEDIMVYSDDSINSQSEAEGLGYDFDDREVALYKDSILEVWLEIPIEDVFGDNKEYKDLVKSLEDGEIDGEEAYNKLWEDLFEEKPVLNINGREWELTDDVKAEELDDIDSDSGVPEYEIEGDYLIKPEIIKN